LDQNDFYTTEVASMTTLSRLFHRLPFVGGLFGKKSRKHRDSYRQAVPSVLVKTGPSLQAANLLRTFGSGETKTFALQDVSLGLDAGQLNVLMGPSGSGKSTLLAVMSALLRPDSGKVTALGQEIWRMDDMQLEKFRLKHCSYIFQGYNLFPALTARQQLEVVLRWGEGCTNFEARKRSEKILNTLNMGHRMNLRPNQLSGGEKQRVAIGRALVKNPSFIFADEPTSALDWENGQQVIELLTGTAKRGTTVLVVTHDPRLLKFAHRVFELADGKITGDGSGEHQALGFELNTNPNPHSLILPGHNHGIASAKLCPSCGPRLHIKDYYNQFSNS
jgi:putative ABC transport system ATP-binding protein